MQNQRKRALITGGSRGIGAECVKMFAKEGYSVVFTYNSSDEKADSVSRETGALALKADVSDPSAAAYAVEKAIEFMGGVDVLVNNAGISSFSTFDDISDDMWERTIGVNLSGCFYMSRAISKHMIRNKYGRIINIGSVWGRCGSSCEVHYSASKAGIRGMTMALAKELGPSSITVNCIEPGVIETDMNSALSKETIEELVDEIPVCRLGQPEDVARAVLFLADELSSYITGQCIGVDGGFAL